MKHAERQGKSLKKYLVLLAKAVFLLSSILLLASCAFKSTDKLLTPPQGSSEYEQLQKKIDKLIATGAEYSPPISGTYRQSVQLEDIDGDGTKEALVFLNVPTESKPLKIYIYKETDGEYTEVAVLEGEGTNVDSVNYIDLNGDGALEIVVGRQISTSIKMLTIYSARNLEMSIVTSVDYLEYSICSLSDDESSNVFIIKPSALGQAKEVEIILGMSGGEMVSTKSVLTRGAESIKRIRTSALTDGNQAVIVEGRMSDGSIFTDIFTLVNDEVKNITLNPVKGVSDKTLRTEEIYCRDIDENGIVEIPSPVMLPEQIEGVVHWLIEWYAYDSDGDREEVVTTYNCTNDGWMLIIPEQWKDKITARRVEYVAGEKTVIFSYYDENDEIQDFLAIYTLSGENKDERANISGRFTLFAENEEIFVARIYDTDFTTKYKITEELIKENFSIIYSEWNPGET